ncbi:hypothetical protein niasHT_000639 [Heterodera trifolii]|uniref:Uncharacterized protein n=1 Tax=Heterodera trifolii TaxID=157864 RepID=A0ABD2MF67_9BILA
MPTHTFPLTDDADKELQEMQIVKLGGNPSEESGADHRSKSAAFRTNVGACKIPKLEVNGSVVMKFYKKQPPLVCNDRKDKEPWVFIDEDRRIMATEKAQNIGVDKIKCLWSFYERISDTELKWTPREAFKFGDLVEKGDFVKVDCSGPGRRKWSNAFMVVVPTADKIKRLKLVRANATGPPPLSVYMLSFDSLSQMSFRRNLPKTMAFLENEMKSVVFNGYNIVGDGTPQAFIPILTAQTEEELPLTRKRYRSASFVDEVYPFAWRNFSAAGYATMYGEDGHDFGTFTYRLKGFKNRPTDHYPITFFHYTETVERDHVCIGNEKQHNVWFRYIESFWREYSKLGIPRFSIMHHSYLSHDDINRVQQVDDDLENHLRKMLKWTQLGGLTNKTYIIWGSMRSAWPFPLDYLSLPPSSDVALSSSKAKSVPPAGRSLSFFREIPSNRTCNQAGIEPHWCTCLGWESVPNSTHEIAILAKSVIKVINEYTQSERKLCALLSLSKLDSAKRLVPNSDLMKYSGVKDADGFVPDLKGNVKTTFATYQISFQTKPGNAKYEATLFFDGQRRITVDMTAISHVNKYGDTPHCIIDKNYFLATYCVCYDKIDDGET